MTHDHHTPGPWAAKRPLPHTANVEICAGDTLIAFATCEQWGYGALASPQETQANARLIGAAPEMLDALRLALRALNTAPRFRVHETDSYAIARKIETVLRKHGIDPYGRMGGDK